MAVSLRDMKMSLYRMRMQHTRSSGTCWIYEFLLHDDALAIDATIAEAKAFVGIDWFEGIYLFNGERCLAYVKLAPDGTTYLAPIVQTKPPSWHR
jgi:hypothetical protein